MTRDQTILVGTPLALNCTLTSNFITYEGRPYTVDSSMLSIKFNKTHYPPHLLNHPDNRTLQLRIESATVQDNGMYFCYLRLPGLNHNATVCLSHVTVGCKILNHVLQLSLFISNSEKFLLISIIFWTPIFIR